jgi:hypothetical protein
MAQRERKDEQPTAGTDHEVDDPSRPEATSDQGDRTDLLRRLALAEAEQAKGQVREAALAARLIDAESDLASLVALEAEASEQRRRADKEGARAERAERTLRDVTGSVSWRLTRPLRAARTVFSARAR